MYALYLSFGCCDGAPDLPAPTRLMISAVAYKLHLIYLPSITQTHFSSNTTSAPCLADRSSPYTDILANLPKTPLSVAQITNFPSLPLVNTLPTSPCASHSYAPTWVIEF